MEMPIDTYDDFFYEKEFCECGEELLTFKSHYPFMIDKVKYCMSCYDRILHDALLEFPSGNPRNKV